MEIHSILNKKPQKDQHIHSLTSIELATIAQNLCHGAIEAKSKDNITVALIRRFTPSKLKKKKVKPVGNDHFFKCLTRIFQNMMPKEVLDMIDLYYRPYGAWQLYITTPFPSELKKYSLAGDPYTNYVKDCKRYGLDMDEIEQSMNESLNATKTNTK